MLIVLNCVISFNNLFSLKNIDIFVRPIMPTYNNEMSAAVAVMNRGEGGTPTKVTFTPRSIGLTYDGGYLVKEVFESTNMGSKLPDDEIEVMVNPSGGKDLKALNKRLKMM